MSPLLVSTPITMAELKGLYTLWIYDTVGERNKMKTAKILELSRPTTRSYLERGRALRTKILARDDLVPGVEFLEVARPVFVTNQTARCPKCGYKYSGERRIPCCAAGCLGELERGTEEAFSHYA